MKIFILAMVLLLACLQYKLWFAPDGLARMWVLKQEVAIQQAENAKQEMRNKTLVAEVQDLKQGDAALEERARSELGMVKQGESFYQVMQK